MADTPENAARYALEVKKIQVREEKEELNELLKTVARNINRNPDLLAQFSWNFAGSQSDFLLPTVIEQDDSLQLQPGMNDIMLAKVATLGHRDKFPRQYDWENIIPTLAGHEELLWIINKKGKEFSLFFGLKYNQEQITDISTFNVRRQRFQVLCDSFARRAFPESGLERQDADDTATEISNTLALKNLFCLIGMPSYKNAKATDVSIERDEEKRPFASINDVIESHINVDEDFSIIFTIAQAPGVAVQESAKIKFDMRNQIKPFLEQSYNLTTGASRGTNCSLSITPAHEVKNVSTSTTKKHNCLKALWQGMFGNNPLKSEAVKSGKDKEGKIFDRTPAETQSKSTTFTPELRVTSEGSHEDKNVSASGTFSIANSELKFIDEQLEESLTHLRQIPGTGGYFSAILVYAESSSVGESVSRSIRASLSGSQSYLRPIQLFRLGGATKFPFYNLPIHKVLRDHGFFPDVLNCEKACLSLLLPDTDCPGIKLKQSVFYSRAANANPENTISVGPVAYYKNQVRDEQIKLDVPKDFLIKSKDLCSHVFLVGTTGSGKTERAAHILNHITLDMRILVLETAKKTYWEKLHRNSRKLCVYTLGNSQKNPFRINPFFFERGSNLKQHIAVLADAIADLLPMEALIGPKLREAVENCYKNCGWDVERSVCVCSNETYPDMLMFNNEVNKICDSLSDYGPEVRSNYRGALLNRSRIFVDDVYQDIFAYEGNKTIDEMFPSTVDTIIEMEDMPPSEINMPAFIISILLHRIRSSQGMRKDEKQKFMIAIEEAHNVLSRKFEEKGDETRSGKGGHLVNQVVRLLAEGRGLGMGIMVIDQSANTIAPAVIANTNMKIVFRQEDGEEIKTIGTAIGIPEENWPDLQQLDTGECIIKSKTSFKPIKLAGLENIGGKCAESITISNTCAPYISCEKILRGMYGNGIYTLNECIACYSTVLEKCRNNHAIVDYIIGKFLLTIQQYDLLDYFLLVSNRSDKAIINVLMMAINPKSADLKSCLSFLAMAEWPEDPLRGAWADCITNGNGFNGISELQEVFQNAPHSSMNAATLKAAFGRLRESWRHSSESSSETLSAVASCIKELHLEPLLLHQKCRNYITISKKEQYQKEVASWQTL